jgi:methylated-DNA-[protein]-cysteine S-methyltransferase
LLIAKALNSSPRAVGQALKCNPFAPKVPCHRVVASSGALGGFMGQTEGKEIARKISLLKEEGVLVKENAVVDFENVLFSVV